MNKPDSLSKTKLHKMALHISSTNWKAFANRVRKKCHIESVQPTDTPSHVVDKALDKANYPPQKKKRKKTLQKNKITPHKTYNITKTVKDTWTHHKQKIMSSLFFIILYFVIRTKPNTNDTKPNTNDTKLHTQKNPYPLKPPSGQFTNDTIVENANNIFKCYREDYEPPNWSRDNIIELIRTHQVRCYYPETTKISVVKRALSQREPVNIAGNREYFDEVKLYTHFGYEMGYYDLRKSYVSKPNIAVYCTSPVKKHPLGDITWVDKMHFLHCIGYAFDSETQTDYKEIIKGKLTVNYTNRLLQLYKNIFHIIFTCAKQYKLRTIALGLVGAGFFSNLYNSNSSPNTFMNNVFQPALQEVINKHGWNTEHIQVLGYDKIIINDNMLFNIGFFPNDALNYINPETTLVVNAWDPLSIVGNGNASDHSLDGAVGMHTACGLLCFPYTNPNIEYQPISAFTS